MEFPQIFKFRWQDMKKSNFQTVRKLKAKKEYTKNT